MTNTDFEILINQLDFEKIQKTMAALDWSYGGHPGTPSVDRLKNMARSVARSAYIASLSSGNYKRHLYQCGGFKATAKFSKKYKTPYIKLEFIIEEASNDI